MIAEAKVDYDKARRTGLRTVNSYKANGWNANLPSLDAILSRSSIMSEVSLGLTEIPIKKIKGTRTNARRSAFAPDFMPILGQDTEFASKWISLCVAHKEEGIREPIQVYEYLNWYYVEEGNKRVSVLKFNDAALVAAYVTRLIPRYDKDDPNIVLYYEFLDFYKKTHMNFLYFTELGSFVKMYKWVEKYGWNLEENEGNLRILYYRFRTLFKKLGGSKIEITTGDAFLKYLDVYAMVEGEDDELEKNLKNLWHELVIVGEEEHYELALAPVEQKKSLFSGLTSFTTTKKNAKIAFIHAKSKEKSAWTYSHEMGRQHVENVFKGTVKTFSYDGVPQSSDAYNYISQVAQEDYDVIFTTSPAFIHETLKASMEYEDIKFLCCSENLSYRHLRTYFGRIYEPNFLVGMIAGAMSKTHQLGYVVSYPIPEVISNINAFTLGARFMNPYAEVNVKWVDEAEEDSLGECFSIDEQLVGMGVDIICHQESTDLKSSLNTAGIYFAKDIDKDSLGNRLAAPIWDWGTFYEQIIRNIMDGNYNKINGLLSSNDRAISYWWGMDAGVVDVMYSSSKVPEPLRKSVEFMKKMIIDGVHHPFLGPVYDQKDYLRVDEGRHLSSEEILSMDWFVKGVIGSIPSINAKDHNHPLLELFSVKKRY